MSVLEHVSVSSTFVLLAGDFNVHVERPNDPHAISLLEIFDLFQLFNRINEPTHILGGTLDLIVSSENFPVSNCKVYPCGIYSDHALVQVSLPLTCLPCVRVKRFVRSWSRMNVANFVSLVRESPISRDSSLSNAEQALNLFNSELMPIVDKVAPLHCVMSKQVPSTPWFDDECRKSKRHCRKLERAFRRNVCNATKTAWSAAIEYKNKLFSEK